MLGFPQELFDYIVDFVHDDHPTLATVRLVSHAWNTAARAHLFRSLDLLISPSPASTAFSPAHVHPRKGKYRGIHKFSSLLSLLETSHNISDCVREVSLGRTTATHPEQQDTYAALLSSILGHFAHLSGVLFREMNWACLAPSFLSSILQICNTRTLERIEIWNCQMPTTSALLDFLSASRNVKSLRLSYFRLLTADIDIEDSKPSSSAIPGDNPVTDPPSRHTEPCTSLLHSLAIDGSPDSCLLHSIFGIRPFSINFLNLRRLYLGSINDSVGVVEFLQKAGHSLESLDMRLTPSKQMQSTLSAVLSHCPRLQHLRISGLQWTPTLCPTEYLSSLFLTPPDQSLPIERVQLMVTVLKPKPVFVGINCIQDDSDYRRAELRYSDWNILDTILSSTAFPVLKSFQISVKSIRERDVDPAMLSDMFPELKNKGVQVICR